MSSLLDSVQEIELKVLEYKDGIWRKETKEYTLNKKNFRTSFPCFDSHCETVCISDDISQLIAVKAKEGKFSSRCPGKDNVGHSCGAGLDFTVKISYID